MITKRDQFSNQQIHVDDINLIMQKHDQHIRNHDSSSRSKSSAPALVQPEICVGDLVYVANDLTKCKQRERYLVVKVDGDFCSIRKFTSTQLRESALRVKKSQCFHVPTAPITMKSRVNQAEVDQDDDLLEPVLHSQEPNIDTDVPSTISTLPTLNPTPSVDTENILYPTESDLSVAEPEPIAPVTVTTDVAFPIDQPVLLNTVEPRRSGRSSKRPDYLKDYEC